MAVKRRIYVRFLIGETVYLYSPKVFGKYEIKEEQVMLIVCNSHDTTYILSNGFSVTDKDVGKYVFGTPVAAEQKMKEVLNENPH